MPDDVFIPASPKKCNNAWLGRHHTEESKRKISDAKKGRPNPHKGYICSDETRRRLSEARRGKPLSDYHKRRISEANTGKPKSEETKRKLSEANRNPSKETRKRMSEAHRGILVGRHRPEEVKRKISKSKMGHTVSIEARRKMSEAKKNLSDETRRRMSEVQMGNQIWLGKHHTEESKKRMHDAQVGRTVPINVRIKMSETHKIRPPSEEHLRAIAKGLSTRPTSLDKSVISVINKHALSYRYVGDGEFWVRRANPDFIHSNKLRICLEFGNIFHHKPPYTENRKSHFAKYGWVCGVLISDHPTEKQILDTIHDTEKEYALLQEFISWSDYTGREEVTKSKASNQLDLSSYDAEEFPLEPLTQ